MQPKGAPWLRHADVGNDAVVVLQPKLPSQIFSLGSDNSLTRMPEGDAELERKVLTYSLWGPLMIRMKTYHD